jgi:hypothetical protein
MPSAKQEKGRKCEELWEPLLRKLCPVDLERLSQGADYKCAGEFYEIKSCRSGLTPKQQETKNQAEKLGGKYHVLRCECRK